MTTSSFPTIPSPEEIERKRCLLESQDKQIRENKHREHHDAIVKAGLDEFNQEVTPTAIKSGRFMVNLDTVGIYADIHRIEGSNGKIKMHSSINLHYRRNDGVN